MNRDELKTALCSEIEELNETELRAMIWMASPMGRSALPATAELLCSIRQSASQQILKVVDTHFSQS